jgi:hypothetical protein
MLTNRNGLLANYEFIRCIIKKIPIVLEYLELNLFNLTNHELETLYNTIDINSQTKFKTIFTKQCHDNFKNPDSL